MVLLEGSGSIDKRDMALKRTLIGIFSGGLVAIGAVLIWAHSVPTFKDILPRPEHDNSWLQLCSGKEVSDPILLVIDTTDSSPFSRYVAEILRAEGILTFETCNLAAYSLDSTVLAQYDLIITTTRSPRLIAGKNLIEARVRRGGRLLMIAPPGDFDTLLGIQTIGPVLTDGYVQFDSTQPLTRNIAGRPVQFFGSYSERKAMSATVLANLSSSKDGAFNIPAAGLAIYGSGKTGFLSYDLGTSVVVLRQGRPPHDVPAQSVDRDGDGVFKTTDLYYDSFDYSNTTIPQADVQQSLFASMIYALLLPDHPIPRVWYFPDGKECVALLTGDHHGQNWHHEIEDVAQYVESKGGRFTFIVYPDMIDTGLVHDLVKRGHDVEPHFYYPRPSNRLMRARLFAANWFSSSYFFRPRYAELEEEFRADLSNFASLRVGPATMTRTHYLIWLGWAETPELFARDGIRLDLSISGVDPHYGERPGAQDQWNSPMGYGYINGSGRPMRFLNTDGELIPLYTQLTQFEDDVTAREVMSNPPNDSVTTAREIALSRRFIDDSINRYHTTLVWNFHPEHVSLRWPPEAPTTFPWIKATVDYLSGKGIPMLPANEWLRFTSGRSNVHIDKIIYNSSKRSGSFTISSNVSIAGLTLLIPLGSESEFPIQIHDNPSAITSVPSEMTLDGLHYAMVIMNLAASTPVELHFQL